MQLSSVRYIGWVYYAEHIMGTIASQKHLSIMQEK